MYGFLGDLGYYGDAVSDLQQKIKATDKKRALTQQKMWKEPIFSAKRRKLELEANKLIEKVRQLKKKLVQLRKMAGKKVHETQVKKILRVPSLRRAYPLPRRGPRPALPPFSLPRYSPMPGQFPGPTRDIDPLVYQRPIDPRFAARDLGPFPPARSVNPVIPQVGLIPGLGPQSDSFTVPPGNISDTSVDTLETAAEDAELSGGFDLSASNPWVLGGLALAALYVVPKLFKGKKAGAVKTNPRRRRRRNRR